MSNISESIREAALSFPLGYVGVTEGWILDHAFSGSTEPPLIEVLCEDGIKARTYMLLVAEALE